jgi:hypothetical protein
MFFVTLSLFGLDLKVGLVLRSTAAVSDQFEIELMRGSFCQKFPIFTVNFKKGTGYWYGSFPMHLQLLKIRQPMPQPQPYPNPNPSLNPNANPNPNLNPSPNLVNP